MRFLLDQNVERRVGLYLRKLGHDVTVGGVDYRGGLPDVELLAAAHREGRVLVTNDSDFGELIVRRHLPHAGAIYFRMPDATAEMKNERLALLLQAYPDQFDLFLTVTERTVRARGGAR